MTKLRTRRTRRGQAIQKGIVSNKIDRFIAEKGRLLSRGEKQALKRLLKDDDKYRLGTKQGDKRAKRLLTLLESPNANRAKLVRYNSFTELKNTPVANGEKIDLKSVGRSLTPKNDFYRENEEFLGYKDGDGYNARVAEYQKKYGLTWDKAQQRMLVERDKLAVEMSQRRADFAEKTYSSLLPKRR